MGEEVEMKIAAFFFTKAEENSPSYKVFKAMFQKQGLILDVQEMAKEGKQIVENRRSAERYHDLINMLSAFAENRNNVFNRGIFGLRKDLEIA